MMEAGLISFPCFIKVRLSFSFLDAGSTFAGQYTVDLSAIHFLSSMRIPEPDCLLPCQLLRDFHELNEVLMPSSLLVLSQKHPELYL
jgi:hypothetical protein